MSDFDDDDLPIEDNLISLDAYKEIPEPNLPLQAEGRRVYNEWCKNLIGVGTLTIESLEHVLNLAVTTDAMKRSIENDMKGFRGISELKRSSMMQLKKLSVSQAPVEGVSMNNPFTKFGFAKRAKDALHA